MRIATWIIQIRSLRTHREPRKISSSRMLLYFLHTYMQPYMSATWWRTWHTCGVPGHVSGAVSCEQEISHVPRRARTHTRHQHDVLGFVLLQCLLLHMHVVFPTITVWGCFRWPKDAERKLSLVCGECGFCIICAVTSLYTENGKKIARFSRARVDRRRCFTVCLLFLVHFIEVTRASSGNVSVISRVIVNIYLVFYYKKKKVRKSRQSCIFDTPSRYFDDIIKLYVYDINPYSWHKYKSPKRRHQAVTH